jgi:iron complex outermembrane receptor protein
MHQNIARVLLGAALLANGTWAFAQSTATRIEEGTLQEVTVSATRTQSVGGLIQAEQATKSRSTVTGEYFATQPAGQTVIQSLNLVPGVNFTNSDPYGSSGGNLRMRSFDGNRISLMVDGVQLNDTGNYAIFTNQQLDPELIEDASVNLGTTDVDSPTASATGGTINLLMAEPRRQMGAVFRGSVGSDTYSRIFGKFDTGELGPWGTRSFLAASRQDYDKFKGPGSLQKTQLNGRIYQELGGDRDFMSLSVHWNRNRNNFYRNLSFADIAANGYGFDNDATCARLTPVAGTAQNEGTSATSTTSVCTNYYNVRVNPSDTGNIRGQLSLGLTDKLRLTVDPSFQYVLANGGGITVVPENDRRLRGGSTATGVDLNGDGDVLDRVNLYTPNNTNTHRYSLNTSLLWDVTDSSLLHLAYTLDYGKHRQTGQYGYLDTFGNPLNVFAGRNGTPIESADGADLRGRDRYTIAKLNQVSLSYSGSFMDEKLRYNLGVRAPFFSRQLNQYCYTQASNGAAYCTTQAPNAPNTLGQVTFTGLGTTTYLRPYAGTKKYHDILPNIGLSFEPWKNGHVFYLSYAEGFSAPRTDNLYSVQILDVQPESTKSYDLGYRYQGSTLTATAAIWKSDYQNRIVSAFDPDVGLSVDRNVGPVKLYGFDGALGAQLFTGFSLYGTASYNHSKVENNVPFSATVTIPTAGKKLVETPDWTYGARAQYKIAGVTLGLQGKHVDERFSTDVNDQAAPSYTVFDADADYGLKAGRWTLDFQLNVINLADRQYLGSVATSRFSADPTKPYGTAAPLYAVGAPRTVQFSVSASY